MARPNRETERHASAWEYWYVLGRDRSIAEVARRFQCSVQAVKGWHVAFSWERRLADRERTVSKLVAQKSVEDEAESRANYLKICRATMIRYAELLQNKSINPTASDIVQIAKLDQLLRGKSDSRTELVAGPIFDKFIELLSAVIEREVLDPGLRGRLALGFQEAAAGISSGPTASA